MQITMKPFYFPPFIQWHFILYTNDIAAVVFFKYVDVFIRQGLFSINLNCPKS
jgi:hypothetical protein